MKGIYVILFILVLFSNSFEFDNKLSTLSDYSLLLHKVRKDVVNEALLNLPKRESTILLKMCLDMSKIKEEYSLNDSESAYLVYKWIADNIEYDCTDPKLNYESPSTVFIEGKSGSFGIAALFKNMCIFMKIKSDIISGLTKQKVNSEEIINEVENYWNYILIDGNYYLIDIPMGAGECFDNYFEKFYSDLFFATKPEYFIRYHFPEDNKWQLLSKEITNKEFTSMAYLYRDFYIEGFRTIEPDTNILSINEDSKMTITYDESITDPNLICIIVNTKDGRTEEILHKDLTTSKGMIEINLNTIEENAIFFMIAKVYPNDSSKKTNILGFLRINFSKNMNVFSKKFFLKKKNYYSKNIIPKDNSIIRNIINYKKEDC